MEYRDRKESPQKKWIVGCYECHNLFEVNSSNEKDYSDSGLCPKCFSNAMRESYFEQERKAYETTNNTLVELLVEIRDLLKKVVERRKI